MSDMMIQESARLLPLPAPRMPIAIRPAVASDLAFMDRLQKMHSHAVGWMPTGQLMGNIEQGRVLVAWASRPCAADTGETPMLPEEPVGYVLGCDRYFKRDDVGIIYQMNVLPQRQRGFIGAALLKAQFERSAYACRLYCCWCAQDLGANKFWEAMGFVPLAFRTGSAKKERVHIFWQKRIRAGDAATPWWFPSETSSGAVRANRIVLPMPPGTHWSDAKPLVLPGMGEGSGGDEGGEGVKQLPAPRRVRVKGVKGPKVEAAGGVGGAGGVKPAAIVAGGLRFGNPAAAKAAAGEKPKREAKPKAKNDPRLVAAARELCGRWLEEVNANPLLPEGKYEVSRSLGEAKQAEAVVVKVVRALPSPVAA